MSWRLWKECNEFCFAGKDNSPKEALECALLDAKEWKELNPPEVRPMAAPVQPQNIRWRKPSDGYLKCNVDATWNKEMGQIGVSCILRDEHGTVKWFGAKCYPKPISSLHAEAIALVWALSCLDNMGKDRVIF